MSVQEIPRLPVDRLPTEEEVRQHLRKAAILMGYTGDPCPVCADRRVRTSGPYPRCETCARAARTRR